MIEVLEIDKNGVMNSVAEVGDTTSVFDEDNLAQPKPVPGYPNEYYIPWGPDDQLPYLIKKLVGDDEVTSQNKYFNVLTCYGAGVQIHDKLTNKPTEDVEVDDWAFAQNLPYLFLNMATDMKYYFFSVVVVILSKDRTRINRILHKDACYCRLQKADEEGRIKHVYYGNFRSSAAPLNKVERIPLLDEIDPLGDLRIRMGLKPGNTGLRERSDNSYKFAMIVRFPTAGCQFYPIPYYSAIFRGGSYDEKRLISVGKLAKLKNHTGIKYQIEVERGYWDRLVLDENITDPQKAQERIKKERENIREFVIGLENSDKAWITQYYVDPNGKAVSDVIIHNVESAKEGGDWMDEINVSANTICYGDNVHPNLVGAVPGKSQSNNSGSDKRELFTMKQSLEVSSHDLLLRPLQVSFRYNGWTNVKPVVPMIMLTTLDEHTDAKRVTNHKQQQNDNKGNA